MAQCDRFTALKHVNSKDLYFRVMVQCIVSVIINYIVFFLFRNSKWKSDTSSCDITVLTKTNEGCLSVGDALREIDTQSIIRSDFVLVNGDIVSNIQLKSIIQKHKYEALLFTVLNFTTPGPKRSDLMFHMKQLCSILSVSHGHLNYAAENHDCP